MYPDKTHPLLLPEILSYVAQYVESKDLTNCNLVCKFWKDTFNQHIWRNCVIDTRHDPLHISVQTIKNHTCHIRSLSYRGIPSPNFLSVRYPLLETLEVDDKSLSKMASNRPWLIVIEIIASSPTLTSINLSANRGTLPIGIWDAIMNSPKVKTLSLARINIKDVRQAKRFYKVCTLLEKLELDNCIDIYYPFFTHDMHVLPECFPSLQEIKFFNTSGYDARNYFRLLELCPELKSLYWHGDIFSLFDFCDGMVAESTFSKLDSLEVRGCSLSHLDLYEFPKKLKNPLKKLAVPRSQFDWFIIENLEERHLQSLQELDISQCTRATSKDFIELLRTCPALTVFKAGILLASDINQDETWLCAKHLTVLHIFIQVDEEDPKTSSRRVFSCLAKLTSLQELDLRASRIEVEYQTQIASPLQLRLDHGLAQLSTLWYLKRLYFNEKEGQDMTMEEGKWIKEHWRMLQVFQGRPSQTPRVATQIRKLFREANARYHRRQPRK